MHIYIYIERERERDIECTHSQIGTHIYTSIDYPLQQHEAPTPPLVDCRRGRNG